MRTLYNQLTSVLELPQKSCVLVSRCVRRKCIYVFFVYGFEKEKSRCVQSRVRVPRCNTVSCKKSGYIKTLQSSRCDTCLYNKRQNKSATSQERENTIHRLESQGRKDVGDEMILPIKQTSVIISFIEASMVYD